MMASFLDRPPAHGERARLVKSGDSPAHMIGERLGTIEMVGGLVWLRLDEPYAGTTLLGPVRLSWLSREEGRPWS